MTENNEKATSKKPLGLNRPGRLELKKTVDMGQVRQSFPHGRSKTVTVEVKKKRTYAPGATGQMAEVKPESEASRTFAAAAEAAMLDDLAAAGNLTASERAARLRALEEAKRDEELRRERDAQLQREAEERQKAEAEAKLAQEAAGLSQPQRGAGADSLMTSVPATERGADRMATPAQPSIDLSRETGRPGRNDQAPAPALRAVTDEDDEDLRRGRAKPAHARPAAPSRGKGEPRRRMSGKLSISQVLDGDEGESRGRSLASIRRAREKERLRQLALRQDAQKVVRDVIIPETITVQDLANRMAERGADVIKALMKIGVMATINEVIDGDAAELVVAEFGHRVKRVAAADIEIGLMGAEDEVASLTPRAPVVTVMGHVDHGKTSLLDALRQTDVAGREAGGITQHIGAYQVTLPSQQKITFIDTPGHAAFSEMRARGANVTDIVVLVVAADDGVMPQTIEAIHHAKAAQVPIIIAINKMDKPDANPARVRQELLQHGLVTEEMGGDILAVEVSAKARLNLERLEEAILLQAEVLELKANPNRSASGTVVEARLEKGRGAVATVLIQRGTLQVGDILVAGSEWGRVRALLNDRGQPVERATPSMPVEILGLQGVPLAGNDVVVVDSETRGRQIAEFRQRRQREALAAAGKRTTLEQMFSKIASGESKELAVVIKSDVQGSLEAINSSLARIGTEEVRARVLHSGVGGINESDVTLARASDAIIIGFNVRANPQAREMARRDNVDIRYYSIIYNVIDDIKAVLSGMLAPTIQENILGYAEIREVFSVTKVGKIAGCFVTEGVVRRGAKVRLLRNDVVIHEGALKTLKRFKDEVREVREGYECGMAFENYQELAAGDRIECFELQEVVRQLA